MDQFDQHIRPATAGEQHMLTGMLEHAPPEQWWSELLSASIGRGWAWTAKVDGTPAGFAVMTDQFFGRPFVCQLFVGRRNRRRGIGSALLAQAEAAAPGARLFVSTNQSNAPMRALLAQRGYAESGILLNLDPGDPELIFVKLNAPA